MHRTKKQHHFWRKVKAFSEMASQTGPEGREKNSFPLMAVPWTFLHLPAEAQLPFLRILQVLSASPRENTA